MRGNLATSLRRRRRAQSIDLFDRLPAELRHWLTQAALPWSPASALRLWRRALPECGGDVRLARERLARAEARLLARDARKIWGGAYPLPFSDAEDVGEPPGQTGVC